MSAWEGSFGQTAAVEQLRRAASRPLHAYLLGGPPGCGVEEAARRFAAALLCEDGGCGECAHCRRALRSRHPDVVEIEPEGTEFLVEQARDVVETAFRSPMEARRKVILLHEVERMNVASANKLLKTFEEPPASTVFVLVTSAPDDLLDTVRSRCQEVRFAALNEATVREALIEDGIGTHEAEATARLAGGRLDRARRLAGDYRALADAFAGVPGRLDGSGGTAALLASELLEAVDSAVEALEESHRRELEELDAEIDQAGYDNRAAARLRRRLQQRHDRAERRAKTDALADGLAVLEAAYRDAFVAGWAEPVTAAEPTPLSPGPALAAVDRVAATRRQVQEGIVLNWGLLVERLLLNLPAAASPADTLAPRPPG